MLFKKAQAEDLEHVLVIVVLPHVTAPCAGGEAGAPENFTFSLYTAACCGREGRSSLGLEHAIDLTSPVQDGS